MIFLCDSGRNTLTVIAAVRAAGTVSTTALHQEAAGPENDICPFQLFTQGYREITWRAAVQLNFFPQKIEISSTSNASDILLFQHNISPKHILLILIISALARGLNLHLIHKTNMLTLSYLGPSYCG